MKNTLSQPYLILLFLYCGIVVGIAADLLRIPRTLLFRKWVSPVCDAVLLLFGTGCIGCAFLIGNGGVLRPYGFLLVAFGMLLSRMTFGFYLNCFTKRLQSIASHPK